MAFCAAFSCVINAYLSSIIRIPRCLLFSFFFAFFVRLQSMLFWFVARMANFDDVRVLQHTWDQLGLCDAVIFCDFSLVQLCLEIGFTLGVSFGCVVDASAKPLPPPQSSCVQVVGACVVILKLANRTRPGRSAC